MNVLAIGCHPDDLEINCAGTLAKYVANGDRVTMCHVANGNMGHKVIEPPELRTIRAQEARTSAALLGVSIVSCDVDDLAVYEGSRELRDKLIEVIRAAEPDVILTHAPNDYMCDHVAVSRAVFDASFAASCAHYATPKGRGGEFDKVCPIYYMDNLAGVGTLPTMYVDISDFMDKKLEMLECHVSQLKWMREHDHIDFADFVRTCAKYRGFQCGAAYAEAFTECLVYPKITTRRLLP